MRGISSHVTIGRAKKGGPKETSQWMDNWFVLVRDDASESDRGSEVAGESGR
jgi:hypothetical protein